jgi:hypothetical protein
LENATTGPGFCARLCPCLVSVVPPTVGFSESPCGTGGDDEAWECGAFFSLSLEMACCRPSYSCPKLIEGLVIDVIWLKQCLHVPLATEIFYRFRKLIVQGGCPLPNGGGHFRQRPAYEWVMESHNGLAPGPLGRGASLAMHTRLTFPLWEWRSTSRRPTAVGVCQKG